MNKHSPAVQSPAHGAPSGNTAPVLGAGADRLITADASKVCGADFLADALGRTRMSEAEKARRVARQAYVERLIAVQAEELAKARRARETALLEGQRPGEKYEAFVLRCNAPFAAARQRVRVRMDEIGRPPA